MENFKVHGVTQLSLSEMEDINGGCVELIIIGICALVAAVCVVLGGGGVTVNGNKVI